MTKIHTSEALFHKGQYVRSLSSGRSFVIESKWREDDGTWSYGVIDAEELRYPNAFHEDEIVLADKAERFYGSEALNAAQVALDQAAKQLGDQELHQLAHDLRRTRLQLPRQDVFLNTARKPFVVEDNGRARFL